MYVCMHVALMIITGIFVNGPYAMITTAVSADLVSTYISVYNYISIYSYTLCICSYNYLCLPYRGHTNHCEITRRLKLQSPPSLMELDQ